MHGKENKIGRSFSDCAQRDKNNTMICSGKEEEKAGELSKEGVEEERLSETRRWRHADEEERFLRLPLALPL